MNNIENNHSILLKDEIERKFEDILLDKSHGAFYLAKEIGEKIKSLRIQEWEKEKAVQFLDILLRLLKKYHPDLLLLQNLVEEIILGIRKNPDPAAVPKIIDDFLNKDEKVIENATNFLSTLSFERIVSISHSMTVEKILTTLFNHVPSFEIFILESLPGGEGQVIVTNLREKGLKSRIIPDSSISAFLTDDRSIVLTGFDQIDKSYFVNKIGTYPLFLMAKEVGATTVLVGSSNKRVDKVIIPTKKIKYHEIEVPLFEKIPLKLVDYLIDENGVNRLN